MNFIPIDWSRDGGKLRSLDASFSSDRRYVLTGGPFSFSLAEQICAEPLRKKYPFAVTREAVASALVALAAYEDDRLLGCAIVKEESWNRRAVISDFYVDRQARRLGVGRKMMEAVVERVATTPMRLLWVETQDVNYPAIQFYRGVGFEICGWDSTLYAPPLDHEIAVYLSRRLV